MLIPVLLLFAKTSFLFLFIAESIKILVRPCAGFPTAYIFFSRLRPCVVNGHMIRGVCRRTDRNLGSRCDSMEAPGLYMYIKINKDVCFTDSSPEAGPSNVNEDQKQRKREEKAVLQDLLSDLPEDEEDYLDLTLTEETEFLKEYKALVDSVGDP